MWSKLWRPWRPMGVGSVLLGAAVLGGCGDAGEPSMDDVLPPTGHGQIQQPSTGQPATGAGTGADGMGARANSSGGVPGNAAGDDGAEAAGGDPAAMDPASMDGAGGADGAGAGSDPMGMDPRPPAGPVDGDPAAPMVSVPGVPCGAPNVSFLGVPQDNIVQIGGRDVLVAYPCAHEGAAVTFFLFIHGTLGEGMKIPFTMTSFPIHTKVDSDNFIVVTPQAIGSQWGNGDGGQDLPHLHEVIDWVYDTFGEQFDIRSMWASGGSWGAFYLSTFACDPLLADRLDGVRMVVGGGCPRCSDGLACIVAQQELELGMGSPLSDAEKEDRVMRANIDGYATAHGCGPREGPVSYGPVRVWTWPDCDAGYAHSYYLGPGEHADSWADPVALDHMVAELKSID